MSSGFLNALSIPLLLGRDFSPADTLASARVAIVNESFVRTFGLEESALGARFSVGSRENIEIIGVIADTKYASIKQQMPPTLFLPRRQEANLDGLTFYVQGFDADALMRVVPRVVSEVDSSLPVTDLRTMERQARNDTFFERLIAALSASLAGLATLLAAIGLYGVIAYNVAQRTREMGLRQALGAKPSDLRTLVRKQVLRVAVIGMVVGVAAALGAARAVESRRRPVAGPF